MTVWGCSAVPGQKVPVFMQQEFNPAEDRRASNLYIKRQFLPQREETNHFNKPGHVQCNI